MDNLSNSSIISVVGNGFIEVEANILEMLITVYNVSDTLKKAQEEVNIVINNVITILKQYNINKKNIHTTSLEFEPNYTWRNNSKEYTGQRVEQTLVCIIENLKSNMGKVVNILDSITVNNNAITFSLQFGIKENREMVLRCRELAHQDATEKAKRYAELSNLKIIKVLKLSENEMRSSYSSYSSEEYKIECISRSSPSTQLPMGKVSKSMSLYMDFLAE